jgi:hypothetical protein
MTKATPKRRRRKFLESGEVLVLRTCNSEGKSYGGFQWPKKGPVVAPDWSKQAVCGYGLHGFLWGVGDSSLANWDDTAKWLVVRVKAKDLVDLSGKVKFPCGEVVYYGDRRGATGFILKYKTDDKLAVMGATATAGDGGTATAGYGGTATAGDHGTATAGDGGTATAGYGGTISLLSYDGRFSRRIFAVGFNPGELKPNTKYKLDNDGNAVEVA